MSEPESAKVSVVMPTYNCAGFIAESIRSVQAQTHRDWELVIIDDRSTDDTAEVVRALAAVDPRINYHVLEENSGAAVARTRGMELSVGRYIAFLDSDDLWHPEKLERQIAFLRRTGGTIVCTAYDQVDEAGRPLGKVLKPKVRATYNDVLLTCPIGNSSVLYDAGRLGKFVVPNIRKRNDDALWLQMLKKEKYILGMPEVLMSYRVRANSISANKLSLIKYPLDPVPRHRTPVGAPVGVPPRSMGAAESAEDQVTGPGGSLRLLMLAPPSVVHTQRWANGVVGLGM